MSIFMFILNNVEFFWWTYLIWCMFICIIITNVDCFVIFFVFFQTLLNVKCVCYFFPLIRSIFDGSSKFFFSWKFVKITKLQEYYKFLVHKKLRACGDYKLWNYELKGPYRVFHSALLLLFILGICTFKNPQCVNV